ncbi:MAG: NUDIX hydrolase [Clostridia bacterium]|nr:NUDIX hydrolase [Clostridia bacterium]
MELFEKTLSSNTVFDGKIIRVRKDKVLLPNGDTSFREVVDHNGGVCVAPLTDEEKLIFVRQFRYPYKEIVTELPAGKLEKGEDPHAAGLRELSEETGYIAERLKPLGILYPTPGYCGEKIYLYLAENMKKGEQRLDEDEFLSVEEIPLPSAVDMVMNGEITDSKTQVLVLKIARILGV